MSYTCICCGEIHTDLPDLGDDKPSYWYSIPAEERAQRAQLTADTCAIDETDYFIRGVIQIPIHDDGSNFGFGVWVSQKKENFDAYVENSDSDELGLFSAGCLRRSIITG